MALSLECELRRKFNLQDRVSATADFVFVPPSSIIKKLWEVPAFRKAVDSQDHVCVEGIYKDLCCGSYTKTGAFSKLEKGTHANLWIQLYQDAAAVNEGKHKTKSITAFYMIIRNIPPQYNSQLKHIHTIALCYTDDLTDDPRGKGHNFNRIMKHIVPDLSKLENGLRVSYQNENSEMVEDTVYGSVVCLSCDNKGFPELLCLAESSNTEFSCRFCLCPKEMLKHCVDTAAPTKMMRPEGNEFYDAFKQARDKCSYKETEGISNVSELTKLQFVSIVDILTVDTFHDGPEGIMTLVLRRILG